MSIHNANRWKSEEKETLGIFGYNSGAPVQHSRPPARFSFQCIRSPPAELPLPPGQKHATQMILGILEVHYGHLILKLLKALRNNLSVLQFNYFKSMLSQWSTLSVSHLNNRNANDAKHVGDAETFEARCHHPKSLNLITHPEVWSKSVRGLDQSLPKCSYYYNWGKPF